MFRHSGVYVRDLDKMETFYRESFQMKQLVRLTVQADPLIEDLLGEEGAAAEISKLITQYGDLKKEGDMLELVKVLTPEKENFALPKERPVYGIGVSHIALSVDDLDAAIETAKQLGGVLRTKIHQMDSGRKCAFLTDPEGNWIEVIQ